MSFHEAIRRLRLPKCGFKPLVGQDVETDGTRNIKKMSKAKRFIPKATSSPGGVRSSFTSVIVRRRGNLSAMAGVLIPFRRNSANGPTA
jgi:hypothetical protein